MTIKICNSGRRNTKRRRAKVIGPLTGIAAVVEAVAAVMTSATKAVRGQGPGATKARGDAAAKATIKVAAAVKADIVARARIHRGTSRKKCVSIIGQHLKLVHEWIVPMHIQRVKRARKSASKLASVIR